MYDSDDILKIISQSLCVPEGEFFSALFGGIANALRVDYAFVAELVDSTRVRTLAFQADGEFVENIEFDLSATPCAEVFRGQSCLYEREIQNLFPAHDLLSRLAVESYLGIPLKSHRGELLGVMVLMSRAPFEAPSMAKRVCEIFASRAASELQRIKAEEEKASALALLEATLQATADGILVVDLEGKITSWNQKFCKLWRLSEEILPKQG